MNFERLCSQVLRNKHRLRNTRKTLNFLKYNHHLLQKKKRRLKLGAIVFDFVDIYMLGLPVATKTEMRYIRQDNTREKELSLEYRLQALNWKWDAKNIIAFLIVFTIIALFIYSFLYQWYANNLPSLAYRQPAYDRLIHYSLSFIFEDHFLNCIIKTKSFNFFLLDTCFKMITNFNFIF